jgi:hypothetical protein
MTIFWNFDNSKWCKPYIFIIYRVNKKCTVQHTEGESALQKKYYVNIGLLKHDFWVMAWWLKNCSKHTFLASTHDISRLNSNCLTCWYQNHLNSILYLLQFLDVTDFWNINSRLWMPPNNKNLSDLKYGKEQAILSVCLVLSIVPEKHSRISKLQK